MADRRGTVGGPIVSTFSDGHGHIYIAGGHVPELRAVGWVHEQTCRVQRPDSRFDWGVYMCDCDGEVVIAWAGGELAGQWGRDEPGPSLTVDCDG